MARYQVRREGGTFGLKRGGIVRIIDPASSHHGQTGGIVGLSRNGKGWLVAYTAPGEGRKIGTYREDQVEPVHKG